jgi:hypothetical protein
MSMRWLKSSTSQSDSAVLRAKLLGVFSRASAADEYTLADLAATVEAPRTDALLGVLAELTRDHVIDQWFRVLSPKNKGGIEDFPSLEKVPDRIDDWRQGFEIDVNPGLVRVLFKKHTPAASDVGITPR